ncbi:hypothetical protein BH10CYA1_BH10CYA1_28690 [soil metagenome]
MVRFSVDLLLFNEKSSIVISPTKSAIVTAPLCNVESLAGRITDILGE